MSGEIRTEYTDHPEFNEWLDNDGENSVTIVVRPGSWTQG